MKYMFSLVFLTAIAMLAMQTSSAPDDAATGGASYEITWYTIDTGGGTSTGDTYKLSGTIGQHDAGGQMVAGDYALNGGYWSADGGHMPTCLADLTGDNSVDVADLLQLLGDWGSPESDLDGDNTTGTSDLLIVLGAWGACP